VEQDLYFRPDGGSSSTKKGPCGAENPVPVNVRGSSGLIPEAIAGVLEARSFASLV
jgi:hypothetical protein